jgi:glycogen debranching enzyme
MRRSAIGWFTPRIGKPAEINALWHNALRIMSAFAARLAQPDRFSALADTAERSFARFVRADGQGLYEKAGSISDAEFARLRARLVQ